MSNIQHDSEPPGRGARLLGPGESALGLPLTLGPGIVADVPEPVAALGMSADQVGLVHVAFDGRVRGSWGLAHTLPEFRTGTDLRQGPLGGILVERPASIRQNAFRIYASPEAGGWRLLVVDGAEEQTSFVRAERLDRLSQGLKRLGKALSVYQHLEPLCTAAVQEIASTAKLAAVMIWRQTNDSNTMELAGSVGITRPGISALNRLDPDVPPRNAAENVCATRKPFFTASVLDHELTGEVEGRYCYFDAGGVRILPLEISGRLVGIMELVGRRGDAGFETDDELHRTVSEHLALALHGATLYENLERLASHDPLTGLANHRALQDFLHLRITECERTGGTLGCIMIDVDHFRNFNEEEGHDAGDEALRQVATALRAAVRPYDLPARYGGEEFTVLVPGASAAGIRALAERLRAKVAEKPFVTASGREVPLTISLGCAVFPTQGPDAPGLLKAADLALYAAKRAGRNQAMGPAVEESPEIAVLRAVLGEASFEEGQRRLDELSRDVDGVAMALRLSTEDRAELEAAIIVSHAWESYAEALRDEPALAAYVPVLDAVARPFRPDQPEALTVRTLQALLRPPGIEPDPQIAEIVDRLRD